MIGADVNRPGVAELLGGHVRPGAQPCARAGQARVESLVRRDVFARRLCRPCSVFEAGCSQRGFAGRAMSRKQEESRDSAVPAVSDAFVSAGATAVNRVIDRSHLVSALVGEADRPRSLSLGSVQMIGWDLAGSESGIEPSGSSWRTAIISSEIRARPKSVILRIPSSVTIRFAGLISR